MIEMVHHAHSRELACAVWIASVSDDPTIQHGLMRGRMGSPRVDFCPRDDGAIEGAHGKLDAIFSAGFTHEAANVGFDGTLLNAELFSDFAIGTRKEEKFKNLVFAFSQVRIRRSEVGVRDLEKAIDQFGEQTVRGPDGAAGYGVDGFADSVKVGSEIEICTGAGDDQLEDGFIVCFGSDDDGADGRMGSANSSEGF